MIEKNKLNNIEQVASTLIGKGKYGEALNYLQKSLKKTMRKLR